MTDADKLKLADIIDRAWAEEYPPELEAWDVKGRKAWRKARLVELVKKEFGGLPAGGVGEREGRGGGN